MDVTPPIYTIHLHMKLTSETATEALSPVRLVRCFVRGCVPGVVRSFSGPHGLNRAPATFLTSHASGSRMAGWVGVATWFLDRRIRGGGVRNSRWVNGWVIKSLSHVGGSWRVRMYR